MSDDKGKKGTDSAPDLVAVAEVSLQVPNGKTAPPFPVPLFIKRVSGSKGLNVTSDRFGTQLRTRI